MRSSSTHEAGNPQHGPPVAVRGTPTVRTDVLTERTDRPNGTDTRPLCTGKLALATDDGACTAAVGKGAGTEWSGLGHGLPDRSVNDLTIGPGGYIYVATHGRGVWRFRV